MDNEQELDIASIVKLCWKKRKIIMIILLISIVVGILYTFLWNKSLYETKTKILIDKSDASIAEFVKSNDLMIELSNKLSIKNSYLVENMNIKFDKSTKIISISATSSNNNQAYEMVNNYQERLKTKLEETYGVKSYKVIEKPRVANQANSVNYIKNVFLFSCVGVIISLCYCIIIFKFSELNIFKEIQNADISLLGKIDKEKSANTKVKVYMSRNEKIISQFKRIMSNIELNKDSVRPKTLLVSGTKYGDGTTYVTVNLAIRYSRAGKKVLIIDSNIRNGIQNKIFNVETERGLTNLLSSENISIENVSRYIQKTPLNDIYVLPVGSEFIEEEMLISKEVERIVNMIKSEFDIIIIDSEPVGKKIIPLGWANIVEAIVIVTEQAKFKINEVIKTKENFEDVNGKVLGVIVNKIED